MRSTLLLLLALAACATAPSETPRSGAARTVQRQNTGVAFSGGVDGNVDFNTQASLETRSYPVAGDVAAVWEAMPAAFASLEIPLAAHDPATHTLGNPGLAVRGSRIGERRVSHYLNCGNDPLTGPVADRADVRLSVLAHVRPAPSGSVIEVQVSGHAAQRGMSSNQVACTSTGRLEEAVANAAKLALVE